MSGDNTDKSKALWRAAYVAIKKLDAIYHGGKAIKTVFSYDAYGHRLRLKETLHKLMFMDLGGNSRRSEELIWRKVFYEPIFLYKLYVKDNDHQDRVSLFEESLVVHIFSAIGYYQSLVLAVQNEIGETHLPDLCGWVSIVFHIPFYCGLVFEFEVKPQLSTENKTVVNKLIHKCLTNIGDLFRYLIDLGGPNAKQLAYRYYKAAFYFDPLIGSPHNQLGILDVGRCYGLNAIFHYLRCLTSYSPFEGAKGNLVTVLAKNEIRYGRITREKSSRIGYPSYFRPKDFRKTIIRFIYLTQQFLKPAESRNPALENIFQDTLAELHSFLLLTDHLTIRSESVFSQEHTDCKSSRGDDGQQSYSVHADEASDQLTGPIFIRMLLISILIYEYTSQSKRQNDLNKSEGEVKESSNEPNHAQEIESSVGSFSLDTDEDENNSQVNPSIKCLSPVADKCDLSTAPNAPDLYGPLSFVLCMGELFITHVCRQIYNHLGQYMEGPKKNQDSQHTSVSPTEKPEITEDTDNPEDEQEDSDGVACKKINSHESLHYSTDNDDDDDDEDYIRTRFHQYSSDEDSEHDFLERRPSDDNESETDFWGSDDSSLLHSQDEINSSGKSSDEDPDVFSDDRLRRASKLNRFGSQRNAKNPKCHKASSKHSLNSKSVDKNDDTAVSDASEEETMQDDKPKKVEVTPKAEFQVSAKDPEVPSRHDPSSESVGKNTYHSSKYLSKTENEEISDPCDTFNKHSYDPNKDITIRISLFSRLYLLSAVKLFLDWLSSSQFEHLDISALQDIDCPVIPDASIKSQKPCSTVGIWRASIERLVSQLTPLLNSIHPLHNTVSHELLCQDKIISSQAYTSDEGEQPVGNLCSHFFDPVNQDGNAFNIVDNLSTDGSLSVLKLISYQIPESNKFSSNIPDESDKISEKESVNKDDVGDNNNNDNNNNKDKEERIYLFPLPEDSLLLGLPSMKCFHDKIDFHNAWIAPTYTAIDETVLRCISLVFHGRYLVLCSPKLGLDVTYNDSITNDRLPFKCDTALSNPCGPLYSHHSNWLQPNRRRRRGRRYHRFYPVYKKVDRYSSFCSNAGGHQLARSDHRSSYMHHKGSSYWDYPRHSGSTRGHKSYYDSRYHSSHSQHRGKHRDTWDTEESDDRMEAVTKSDTHDSVCMKNTRRSESSPPTKSDQDLPCKDQTGPSEASQSRRDQAMRDMARLRLLNEVDKLASQFRNHSPLSSARNANAISDPQNSESIKKDIILEFDVTKSFLSPYLVIDAYCLTSHLHMVKQLVSSKRFILIIPQAVIAHLDYLKKTMATARVAIRYLEHEAHGGNRYLRLQRPEEKPNKPIELHRQDALHSDTQELVAETDEGESKSSTNQNLNLRVVRRWLSILDCASYFAQTLTNTNKSSDTISSESNTNKKTIQLNGSDEQEVDSVKDFLNITPPYCDLLSKECIAHESNDLSTNKTAPVTILIGFRNTAPEDTIVPQEFLTLVANHGVRLELIRSFIQRWKTMKS
uniref:PIN domain-containing protein n=2 Tax=Trichobilharzia regenti TaxID=157069 RepID=A0AA85IKC9_TRIRE|nr:unnamed protein product [Trichobilharzia regenti]